MDKQLRLVCRPRPYPHESLLGYFWRVAAMNGYEERGLMTTWIAQVIKTVLPPRLLTTTNLSFLETLAAITDVPVYDIFRMTLNRYISVLTYPGTPLETAFLSSGEKLFIGNSRQMGRRARTDDRSAFCPECLSETPHNHNILWMIPAVFSCEKHRCWLRDACASCNQFISVKDVVKGWCPSCQSALAQMPVARLDEQTLEVQKALIACLENRLPNKEHILSMTPSATFRFLDGLCSITLQMGIGWEPFYQPSGIEIQPFPDSVKSYLTPIQQGCLYVTGWQTMNDWPQKFYSFLDAYRHRKTARSNGIEASMHTFYSVWLEKLWRHPDLEPIQTAFNHYLVTHFPATREILQLQRLKRYPELREQFAFIDIRNASRQLGVSPPKLNRLVRDGYIRVYPERDPVRVGHFVYRADLEEALQRSDGIISIKAVAKEFKCVPATIKDWLDAGLLRRTRIRFPNGEPQPALTTADLTAFRNRLAQVVTLKVERPSDAVNLKEVCTHNGKVGMTSVQVLQRVLAGKLPVYHSNSELQPFANLWFEAKDVAALTEQVKIENNWMSFLEVWRLLKVSRKVVHYWIDNGLLVPISSFARAVYFNRKDIEDFYDRLLTSSIVARMLDTFRSKLGIWVRHGYLKALSGSGVGGGDHFYFDRDTVAEWHQKYVTPGEVRRLLGKTGLEAFLLGVRHGHFQFTPDSPVLAKFYSRRDFEEFQVTWIKNSEM